MDTGTSDRLGTRNVAWQTWPTNSWNVHSKTFPKVQDCAISPSPFRQMKGRRALLCYVGTNTASFPPLLHMDVFSWWCCCCCIAKMAPTSTLWAVHFQQKKEERGRRCCEKAPRNCLLSQLFSWPMLMLGLQTSSGGTQLGGTKSLLSV